MSLRRDGLRFDPFCCPLYCWGPEPPSNVSKPHLSKRGEPQQRFEPTAVRAFVYKSSALPGVPENFSIPDLPTLFSQTLGISFSFSFFKIQSPNVRWDACTPIVFTVQMSNPQRGIEKVVSYLDISIGIALVDIYTKVLIRPWRIPKFQYIFPFQGRHSSSCFARSCCGFECCRQTSALIMMPKKVGLGSEIVCWKKRVWFNSTLFCVR